MFIQQRRWSRTTKIGVSALASAIGLAALALVLMTRPGETAPNAAATTVTPKVDYMLDLRTGVTDPLPEAIIVSAAEFGRSEWMKYAASPDGSKLAYVGFGDDENPQIFVAAIDGGGIRQLTHDVRETMSPAWSPDGTRIAYMVYGAGWAGNARSLFVVDVATGRSTRVGDRRTPAAPQFTPRGSSIIYTGGSSYSPVIKIIPVAGRRSPAFLEPNEGLRGRGTARCRPTARSSPFSAAVGRRRRPTTAVLVGS